MWKFAGSFSLATGSLSAAVGIGGGETGAMLAAAGLSGRPCAHDGGGAPGCGAASPGTAAGLGLTAGCCAATGGAAAANPAANAAINTFREHDSIVFMAILPSAALLATHVARYVGRGG